jgi:hypothetical protein
MTPALLAIALAAVAGANDSRAHVRLDVSGALVRPAVRIDLDGCRSTRTVHLRPSLGLLYAGNGRFSARTRFSPPGRAMRVRLRFAGRFISPTTARGVIRGRLRYAGGHVCRIPALHWTAHPAAAMPTPIVDDSDEADDLDDAVIDDDEDVDDEDIDDDELEEDDDDGGDEGPEAALP